MPVHMRQAMKGKDKGKWFVVDDAGKVVFGPTTREHARSVVSGRNMAVERAKGNTDIPPKKKATR